MNRVMSAQVERDVRAWVSTRLVVRDHVQDVMNAIRRDVWERDKNYPRGERAMRPFVERGLFGVSH